MSGIFGDIITGEVIDTNVTASVLPTGAATLTEQQIQTTRLASIRDAVEIMDDWDESDRAKVNPIVGQAGIQGGSGAVSANTLRTVLATDVPLPTGTNSIGQVTANAGTNLNTSALALETTQVTTNTRIGDLTETAPGTDTASSGLNGRLQRIAQRISTLITSFPIAIARTTQPSGQGHTDASQQAPALSRYGLTLTAHHEAILADWGKCFSATSNLVSTGTTAQTALVLLRNPNGSGVNVKLRKITFYGNGGTFRVYQGPTITSNGTAVTSSGNRQSGQATAQGLVTTLPTISVNGTVFKSFTVAAQHFHVEEFNYTRLIEPNSALLITIAQSANSAPGSVDIEWAEQQDGN